MIFFRHENINETLTKFEATENEEVFGSCLLDLNGKYATVSEMVYPQDKPYLAEGLLKSAYNYAAAKNFYMGVCKCDNITSLLTRLGFTESDNGYILDIPSILMGSCCKKQEK